MADNLDMVEMAKRMAVMEGVLRGLVSTRQVKRSSIGTYDGEVQVSDVLEDAQDTSSVVPGALGDLVILDTAQSDDFDELSYIREETEEASENAHEASVRATEVSLDVQAAQAAAEEASELAVQAKITADGRNRIYAQALNPVASPEFPFVSGDLWYRTETVSGVTRFVEVFMWNGTEWKPYQMVASSLLVPGTVGPTLIENGAITTGKLAATAIDGMTVTGAILRTAATGRRFVMNALALDGYDEANVKRVSLYPTTTGLRLDGTTATQYSVLNGSSFGVNNVRAGQYDREAFSANSDRFVVQNVFPDPGANPTKQGFATTEGASGFPSDALMAWLRVAVRAPGLGSAGGEQDARLYADDTMAALDLQAPGGGSARIARVKGDTKTVYSGPTFSFESPVKFQGDTDWASVSIPGGTGTCRWMRLAGLIHVQFDITLSSALAAGAALNVLATLPAAAQPVGPTPISAQGQGSYDAQAYVEATGAIAIRNTDSASRTRFKGAGSWPAKS